MSEDPYDFLDQYEQLFDKELESMEKVFDLPVANDPLTIVEDPITPPDSMFDIPTYEPVLEQKPVPEPEIPGPPADDKFKRMSLPSEIPAGLLDKPGKTHGLDHSRWRSSGGGGAHHRSLTGLSKTSRAGRKFTSYSTESEYCKDKQKYLDFPDECQESNCRKLIEVRGYGLMCEDHWRWKVDVTKNLARAYFSGKNSSILLSNESWNILREHGGEEFRRIVEEHDREEREYEERSRRLSEEGLD